MRLVLGGPSGDLDGPRDYGVVFCLLSMHLVHGFIVESLAEHHFYKVF